MLRGLASVGYVADDVPAAARWYAELLGIEPYFLRPDAENPAYVEFRVGRLRARARHPRPPLRPGLLRPTGLRRGLACRRRRRRTEAACGHGGHEAGFVTASVLDPFGNVLGVTYNPHYLDVLARDRADRPTAGA